MKVFIITEGGRNIGFGHITRCIALCQAFEERGIKPEFIINGDNTVKGLLNGRRCQVFNWLKEEGRLFKIINKTSIAIIDSYLADVRFYKRISSKVEISVYIDDNNRLDYPRGFVVNGAIYAEELNYRKRGDTAYLLGGRYIPLRRAFWNLQEKEIKDEIESIMVTFGGDDSRNITPKILKLLCENYPFFTKKIIIGKGFDNIRESKQLKDKKTELIYNPDAEGMKNIMLESDIAISAGGQTLYEFAAVRVPTIGICVSDNQERNLKAWFEKGFIEYAGRHNDADLTGNLKTSIEHLKNPHLRKKKSEIGKKYVDGKGGRRIVKAVLSDLFKNKITLRNANFRDASDIFNLSNDDVVRRNSFNSEKINWVNHIKWMKEKLNDNNCVFFIINMQGTFLGQLRFDINREKKEAIVNVSFKKGIRNLGLGSLLLDRSIYELIKLHNDVRSITAYVKETNPSSIKVFEKANFKFSKNTIIKGCKTKVLMRKVSHVRV